MGWLGTIGLGIVFVAAGLYLALGVAIIVTALVERRLVKALAPAEPDDPEWQRLGAIEGRGGSTRLPSSEFNPYAAPGSATYPEPRIRAASRLGFSASRLFKPVKGGIYKTPNVLGVSPCRQILAVIRWGTTASIRNELTTLYSELQDGCYLVTSDRLTGTRVPGFSDDLVLLRADFDQLVSRHEARLLASGRNVRPLSAENPLAELETIRERRARFLVDRGEAYWVDPAETEFRSTLKGALKLYAQTFSTSHVDRSLSASISVR
jgi:hypothetical protein